MTRIVKFKYMGSFSRKTWLDYSDDRFWIEPGTIALQIAPVFRYTKWMSISISEEKDVVHLLLEDGSKAYAVCAPGGWEPWIEEL